MASVLQEAECRMKVKTVQTIDNALILPRGELQSTVNGRPHVMGGQVNDGDAVLPQSLLWETFPVRFHNPYQEARRCGEAIFAGVYLAHFGHFLLDSLSRLWFYSQFPDMDIVWCNEKKCAPKWIKEILELLGVENRQIFCRAPTVCERLHLPVPMSSAGRNYLFTEEQAQALARVESEPVEKGKRLYLSRSRLTKHTGIRFHGESVLEAELERRGWRVFHPQEHSVSEQLAQISSSEVVSGCLGSAFHSVMLLKNLKTKFVPIQFYKSRFEIHDLIALVKKIDFINVPAEGSSEADVPAIVRAIERASARSGGAADRHPLPKGVKTVSDYVEAKAEQCAKADSHITWIGELYLSEMAAKSGAYDSAVSHLESAYREAVNYFPPDESGYRFRSLTKNRFHPFYYKEVIDSLDDKRIYVFGASGRFESWGHVFEGAEIVSILDNNEKLWGTRVRGIPVAAPSELPGMEPRPVFLMSIASQAITRQLESMGLGGQIV